LSYKDSHEDLVNKLIEESVVLSPLVDLAHVNNEDEQGYDEWHKELPDHKLSCQRPSKVDELHDTLVLEESHVLSVSKCSEEVCLEPLIILMKQRQIQVLELKVALKLSFLVNGSVGLITETIGCNKYSQGLDSLARFLVHIKQVAF
jgi:hypothetical protein